MNDPITFDPPLTKEELKSMAERRAAGLSREQAEQVIAEQRLWDAHPENPKNKEAAPEATAEVPAKKGKKPTAEPAA